MKRVFKRGLFVMGLILVMGGVGLYRAYEKVGDKLITETLSGQIITEFSQQTGIDLRESDRVLTEEEIECFKSVIETKEEIAQEDDLKGVIEKQAKTIVAKIPSQDKRAMIQLILGNLTSSDISYLTGLVLDEVSGSDISEAKRIAKERFTSTELAQIKDY